MLPKTTSMLLDALKDPGSQTAWKQFDARYRPVLCAFAGKLGLGDDEAREVAQETLTRFVQEYLAGRYDRDRGRLRSWLFSIARTRVARLKRERGKTNGWRGESALTEVVDEQQLRTTWNAEWRKALLLEALEQLRAETRMDEKTIRAFEMVSLEARPVAEVATALGMTENSVNVARYRAFERLQRILARAEEEAQ